MSTLSGRVRVVRDPEIETERNGERQRRKGEEG
jgi:hypothetical protein